MEDIIIQELREKINAEIKALKKAQKELETAIGQEGRKTVQNSLRKELEEVENKLNAAKADMKEFKRLLQKKERKETSIEEAGDQVISLTKTKQELEEEIKKQQSRYEDEEGKLAKSYITQEFEAELAFVNEKINEKMKAIEKGKTEIENIEADLKKMAITYKIDLEKTQESKKNEKTSKEKNVPPKSTKREEKIVKELEKKLNEEKEALEKDKKELQAEIKKESKKSIEPTYIQEDLERQLEYVEGKLASVKADIKIVKSVLQKKEKSQVKISQAREAIVSLTKTKQMLEEEIAKEQQKYGKSSKSATMKELEAELTKVKNDLNKKMKSIEEGEAEIATSSVELQEIATRYQIETEKQKEGGEKEKSTPDMDAGVVKQQEEQMWEEYRRAQQEEQMWDEYKRAQEEEELARRAEADKMQEEMIKRKQKHEQKEQKRINAQTRKEIEQYDADLGDRQDNPDPIIELLGEETRTQQKEKQNNVSTHRIDEINFYIDENGEPVYEAIIYDENKKTNEKMQIKGWDNVEQLTNSEAEELKNKSILKAKKYYDPNIAKLLAEVDEIYGTNGQQQYMQMMKTKFEKNRYSNALPIKYDFSNSYSSPKSGKNKDKLDYITKLAKANYKIALIEYVKRPSLLKRLFSKPKTKLLSTSNTEEIRNPEEEIEQLYTELRDEQGFGLKNFVDEMKTVYPQYTEKEIVQIIGKIDFKLSLKAKEAIKFNPLVAERTSEILEMAESIAPQIKGKYNQSPVLSGTAKRGDYVVVKGNEENDTAARDKYSICTENAVYSLGYTNNGANYTEVEKGEDGRVKFFEVGAQHPVNNYAYHRVRKGYASIAEFCGLALSERMKRKTGEIAVSCMPDRISADEYTRATGLPYINGMSYSLEDAIQAEENQDKVYPYIVGIQRELSSQDQGVKHKDIQYIYTSLEAYQRGEKPYIICLDGIAGRTRKNRNIQTKRR